MIKLDAGCSPDFAACCDGNRAWRYQYDILDTDAMRIGYSRGDFFLDAAEVFGHFLLRLASLFEFDDHNKLFCGFIHDGYGCGSVS